MICPIEKKDYSRRRAAGSWGWRRGSIATPSRRGDADGVRVRLGELAAIRRRFGYRRLHFLLKREGVVVNHKKFYGIYREERLTVRRRGGRKRAPGTRTPMAIPQGRNRRWPLDFVSDTLVEGRRFRVLVIVDDFTRECLTLLVDTSLSGVRVARELDRLVALRGRPAMKVSDNGAEFTSHAMLRWSEENRVELHSTSLRASRCETRLRRGLNGRFRDERLNEALSRGPIHARHVIEDWRPDYNTERPHTSLDELSLNEFAARFRADQNRHGFWL